MGLGGHANGLTETPALGAGHPRVLASLVLGLLSLVAFIAVEKRAKSPMVPLALFESREFTGTNLLTFLLYMALGGALFFFPFNLVQLQGYSATNAGLSLLPFILIMFLLSRSAGRWADRIGPRLPLVAGPSIAALGFALFARPGLGGSYWTTFFPAVLVLGLGMALSVAPLTTTVMHSVPETHAGTASGINNAVSRTAGLLAIAVMGLILATVFDGALDTKLADLDLSKEEHTAVNAERSKLAGAEPAPEVLGAKLGPVREAIDEAFLRGFRMVMAAASVLSLLAGLSAWWFLEPAAVRVEASSKLAANEAALR
jgi:MFS family permease